MMTAKKRRRIWMLAGGGGLMAAAAVLVGVVFSESFAYFMTPSEIRAETPGPDRLLRVGGLVVEGSVARGENGSVTFEVTDTGGTVPVRFGDILPDLFREGQGVVAQGYWRGGVFEAVEVLARHDEEYVPKEVEEALKQQGVWKGDEGQGTGG